jgi:hypothetical protein
VTPVDDAWLGRFARALAAARGNDRFVSLRALAGLATAWAEARALSPRSVPAPVVDPRSGMPPWSVWAAVLAEAAVGRGLAPATTTATTTTATTATTAGARDDDDPRARLRRREDAARRLARVPALPLVDATTAVRRVEGAHVTLTFVLDRVDGSGLFVRIAADLRVAARARDGVIVDDDRVRVAEPLVAALSRASHLPAPAVLVALAGLRDQVDGLVVERLTRGVVGPFGAPGAALAAVAEDPARDACLVLAHEELAPSLSATVDNDVFADDDLGALVARLPPALGPLRAFRDARVVASAAVAARVAARARARGTKTTVTTLPP